MFLPRLALLAIVLVGGLVAPLAPARAQTTPAAADTAAAATVAGEKKFSIEYRNDLLGVREEGGAYVFAQSLTGRTVRVRFETDGVTPGVTLYLQDEKGKNLWTNRFRIGDPKTRAGHVRLLHGQGRRNQV